MARGFSRDASIVSTVILAVLCTVAAAQEPVAESQMNEGSAVAEARRKLMEALQKPKEQALETVRQYVQAAKQMPDDMTAVAELRWLGDAILREYAAPARAAERAEGIRAIVLALGRDRPGARYQATGLSHRLALDALEKPEELTLQQEVLLARSALGVYNEEGELLQGEAWAAQRRRQVKAWLHMWQRIEDAMDPNWDPNESFGRHAEPPPGSGIPTGASPEAIQDPKLRAEYEKAIEVHRRKMAYYSEQYDLRNTQLGLYPDLVKRIAIAYSRPPDGAEELNQLVAEYRIPEEWRQRITGRGPAAPTQPGGQPAASQPSSNRARVDFEWMLEQGKAAWVRGELERAEQLAQDVLKHPQATDEQKRQAQLILDRVAESRSGPPASQPAAPPATQPSSAPTGQRP